MKSWFFVRSDVESSRSHVAASAGSGEKEPRTDFIDQLYCFHLFQLVSLSHITPALTLMLLGLCRHYGHKTASKAPNLALYPLAGRLAERPRLGPLSLSSHRSYSSESPASCGPGHVQFPQPPRRANSRRRTAASAFEGDCDDDLASRIWDLAGSGHRCCWSGQTRTGWAGRAPAGPPESRRGAATGEMRGCRDHYHGLPRTSSLRAC